MEFKVVVIEDEEYLAELIKINLGLRGIDVFWAESGEEGYNLVIKIKPDLILLDARLPDVDGWEICMRLKNDNSMKKIPIIFVTAAAQESDKIKAKEAGADGFLAKPFQISDLLQTIQKYKKGNTVDN